MHFGDILTIFIFGKGKIVDENARCICCKLKKIVKLKKTK